MGNLNTTPASQVANVGNQVTETYSPGRQTQVTDILPSNPFLTLSREKEAPQNLAEDINHSSFKSGATIMVIDRNDADNILYVTNKFYLRTMSFNFQEKVQLLETFDVSNISFFGERVKVYNFAGNTVDYPSQSSRQYESMQHSSLMQLYDSHLRGSQLIKNNHMGILKVMNHLVYGYPMQLSTTYTAGADKIASFNLSWVVADHVWTLPGIATEGELERLYTPQYQEEVTEYVNNINRLLFPLKALLRLQDDPALDNLFDKIGYYSGSGLYLHPNYKYLDILNLNRSSYDLIKENANSLFASVVENMEAVATEIEQSKINAYGYTSPALAQWDDLKIDNTITRISRISNSWVDYLSATPELLQLNKLKTTLEQFKLQLLQ